MGSEKKLPARVNMQLFNKFQTEFAANLFTPESIHPAVYDHQENSNRLAGLEPDQPDVSTLSELEWRHNTLPMP
jgi:hypothetical protein